MSWPVSDEFKAALATSHTVVFQVDILERGRVVATSGVVVNETMEVQTPTGVRTVSALDGSVTADRNSDVRFHASVDLVDVEGLLTPLLSSSYLHPLTDRQIRVWRGIDGVPANDTYPLVPMATVQFQVLDVTEHDGIVTYTIGGDDPFAELAGIDWPDALDITDGTSPADATTATLDLVRPGWAFGTAFAPTAKTLPAMTFLPGDQTGPLAAIRKFWEAAAMEAVPDQLGRLISRPIPDPATTPVAHSYVDGPGNIRVPDMKVSIDRRTLRNAVIVRLSAPWAIYGVTGEAHDTDPDSPTRVDPDHLDDPDLSPVGYHPEYVDDSFVADEDEAAALAAAKLPGVLGVEQQVTYDGIPNPALTDGDVVELGTDLLSGRFVLDQVQTPLGFSGSQQFNTRRRTR